MSDNSFLPVWICINVYLCVWHARTRVYVYVRMMYLVITIFRSRCFRAFFVGMKATIMRDVPWNALSFLFFNAFKMVYEGLLDKV